MPRPRFRLGLTELTLHRRRDCIKVRDRAAAETIIDAYLEAGSITELERDFNVAPGDRTAIRARLISALLHGDLFLIRLDTVRPLQTRVPQWLEPRDEPAPAFVPLREPTWVAFTIVHESGAGYPGARLNVMLPDGEIRVVALDDASRVRIDDIPDSGSCRIRPRSGPLSLPDGAPRTGAPSISLQPPDTRMEAGSDASVSVSTGSEHRIVVVEPVVAKPRAKCVRLYGALFALNKSFLLPSALEGVRLLEHMYATMPGAEILVVGHTDTTGSATRNQSLSLQRAESVLAYCRDDVEAWYANYSTGMDHSRRWGPAEDLAMLSALPHGSTPYYGPHHEEHSLPAAIRRFQEAHRLVPDADAGRITRRAMIAAYMAADGTSLPAATTMIAHGCGQWFQVVPTEDDVDEPKNRRVEIFFFADGVDPRPGASTSTAGAPEYDAWRENVEEERTFTPSEAGLGSLLVATDIHIFNSDRHGTRFVLRSTDGAYEREMVAGEHGHVHEEHLDLVFEEMPRGSFYTLAVEHTDGRRYELFSDVPYLELGVRSRPHSETIVPPDPAHWPKDEAAGDTSTEDQEEG